MIAGSGYPTIGQIHDYYGFTTVWGDRVELPFGVPKLDADVINGDDTVPLLSATLGTLSHVYYTNQTHMDLPSGAALQMAYNLLNGEFVDIPGIKPIPFAFDGKIISVHSPVTLNAYDDQGRHTGPKEDGTFEEAIPGSSFDQIGESKFIYLPNGGQYNIKTKATVEGRFDLKIKTYAESALTKEQLYLAIPQTEETTTSMTLDSDSPTLQVDTDNNGTVDETVSSSSTLTGDDLADTQAPTTTVQASGTEGADSWYRSDVTFTLSADDTGAGILRTYYYKDAEQTLHDGNTPLTIDTEGTTKI